MTIKNYKFLDASLFLHFFLPYYIKFAHSLNLNLNSVFNVFLTCSQILLCPNTQDTAVILMILFTVSAVSVLLVFFPGFK